MKYTFASRIKSGETDAALSYLYGKRNAERARERCLRLSADFEKIFGCEPEAIFSAPGRSELGGNHTDHQCGHVLAAAVDLDILAAVKPNGSGVIRMKSEGYPMITVDTESLTPVKREEATSEALVRGVASAFAEKGVDMSRSGFDACLVSDVPGGSGLSSSAAFEILVGTIFNELYFGSTVSPVELAKIGQRAENVYFGKPCGLMDQIACSVGGVAAVDLKDPAVPVVEKIDLELDSLGYALCIMDSHASHADLTDEYAAIAGEMAAVSRHFGKRFLREVPEADFLAELSSVRAETGDRALLRAMHFYSDDKLAVSEAESLKNGDFDGFLRLVKESGKSSAMYLQNVVPTGHTEDQALMLTVALAERLLLGRGAARVHGGGFGGTAQAYVPLDMLNSFIEGMEALLGEGSVHAVRIRPVGGYRII